MYVQTRAAFTSVRLGLACICTPSWLPCRSKLLFRTSLPLRLTPWPFLVYFFPSFFLFFSTLSLRIFFSPSLSLSRLLPRYQRAETRHPETLAAGSGARRRNTRKIPTFPWKILFPRPFSRPTFTLFTRPPRLSSNHATRLFALPKSFRARPHYRLECL